MDRKRTVTANNLPPGYRITELGPLPEEWKIVRGSELFRESKLRVRNLKKFDGVILSITRHAGLIPQEQKFKKRVASRDLRNYKIVYKGQLVYGFPINEGVIGISFYSLGAVSPAYHVWDIIDNNVDLQFIDWLVKHPSMIAQYMKFASNVVHRRKNLKPKDFLKISFPLPPLSEQRAIAYVLRSVQEAKEKTENVINALKELKRSLMKHLFTYGPVPIDKVDRVKLKETEIGRIPEHWKVVRLGEVLIQVQYGLSKRGKQEGLYPILRMNNIQEGWITTHSLQYVDLSKKEFFKFRLEKQDILFNRTNSFDLVGKAALFDLEGDYVFASYLIRLKVNTKYIEPYFLNYLLNWESTQNRLKGLASRGVSQSNISATKLKGFEIPLPPFPEQKQIVHILRSVDEKIETEKKRLEALDKVFKALLNDLMTAKRRLPKEFINRFRE